MKNKPTYFGCVVIAVIIVALTSCDLVNTLVGQDPVTELLRNNPVDPEASNPLTGRRPDDREIVQHTTPLFCWQSVDGVQGYHIQVSDTESFEEPVFVDVPDIEATQYQLDTVLQNNRSYYWRIRPQFADGRTGGWSEGWHFEVELPIPQMVSPVQDATVNTPHPPLSWEIVDGIERYTIQISESADFSSIADEGESVDGTYSPAASLLNDTLYYWRVCVVENGVSGDWCEPSTVSVEYPLPKNPSPSSESAISNKTPALTWDADPDAIMYQIQISEAEDFALLSLMYDVSNLTTPKYVVPDELTSHDRYYWRVRAKYSAETPGVWSDTWSFEEDGVLWSYELGSIAPSVPVALDSKGRIICHYRDAIHVIDRDGQLLWTAPFDGGNGGVAIGPNDQIHAYGYNGISSFDLDGNLLWEIEYVSRFLAIAEDGTIYGSRGSYVSDTALFAAEPDGTIMWEFSLDTVPQLISGCVINEQGTIIVLSYSVLYGVNPDGTQRWKTLCTNVTAPLIVGGDGSIYARRIMSTPIIEAFSPEGVLNWEYYHSEEELGASGFRSVMTDTSGMIYGILPTGIYRITPDGSSDFRIDVPFNLWFSNMLIGSDGNIYIHTANDILAIDETGSILWRTQFPSNTELQDLLMDSQGVLLACGERAFYAIETTSTGLANSSWPMNRHDPQRTGRAGP